MNIWLTVTASVASSALFLTATRKTLGAMQQCGYRNSRFFKWLKRKDNLFFNRLSLLSGMLLLFCALTALSFSPFGTKTARLVSAVPFFFFCFLYVAADGKYALKVPMKRTGRLVRLGAVYLFFLLCFSYLFLAVLFLIGELIGEGLCALFVYIPFCLMPLALPFLLIAANKVSGIFEDARNKKFVKRAGQVLDETDIIRVCVTGSYGKTSVKKILSAMLSKRYSVVATPESYNTPVGIAKTVLSSEFAGKEIFIAEAGARNIGDVAELCRLVKPNYSVFTGVCAQHIETFGSEDNVFKGKSEIVSGTKENVYCGESLRERLASLPEEEREKCVIVPTDEDATFEAMKTTFSLTLCGEKVRVSTVLLGKAAVENISLAAALAERLGATKDEILSAIETIEPVSHRLQAIESGGVFILDDGYNCNIKGAGEAIAALKRFGGRKTIVTPGITETGILKEKLSAELGALLVGLDDVVLVGNTLVGAVKNGYLAAGGDEKKLRILPTLDAAKEYLKETLEGGDAVLFLNDLPDVY